MKSTSQRFFYILFSAATVVTFLGFSPATLHAQFAESTLEENGLLLHGIEQYQQGHYQLAAATLKEFLKQPHPDAQFKQSKLTINGETEKGQYYYLLSCIKNQDASGITRAEQELNTVINPDYKSHIAFNLGQYFFSEGNLQQAIQYYNQADIAYLNNEEIADKKFELAYSYFNNQQFDKAQPLFAAIKDLPKNKYYIPGNYYYGLLAYNSKNYQQALKSFERIDQEPTYSDVVPYYEAEIYYFIGQPNKVLEISKKYLHKDSLYYTRDMRLLTAQTLFEQKDYAEALPYFENYYNTTNKIRKEELYELAYCYYRLSDWQQAIDKFQPLSNIKDSLGQTAMYLLGDCYLKINDKKGARNAFGLCSDLNFNSSQTEAASFLYAKLSDELGDETLATRKLSQFIQHYPNSEFTSEASVLFSQLLAKSSNYAEAFKIISNIPIKNNDTWRLFQKVAVGRALQLLQENRLEQADSILNLSLQQPVSSAYEAVAYFWKGEIAYRRGAYQQAIEYSNNFLNQSTDDKYEIERISQLSTPQNARMNIGYAQMELGDYSNAQQAFAQARKSNPGGKANATAVLHEADACFMQSSFPQAKKLYQSAIDKGISSPDYAKYQIAVIDGLTGDEKSKEQILNDLINQQPASSFQSKARYELALSALNNGNTQDALTGFSTLLNNPSTPENIRSKALISMAYAFQTSGDTTKAIDAYQQFIKIYPADTARDMALEALRSIYVANDSPQKYLDFIKENNLPDPSKETLENTYYDAAFQSFNKQEWAKAINGFSTYLQQFQNGKNAVRSHFYRGLSYEKTNQDSFAVHDFDTVINFGWNEFTESAAANAAKIYFSQNAFENALVDYNILRNNAATDNQLLKVAYEGLMKCNFALNNFDLSKTYADTLLTLPGLADNTASTAQLYQANSLLKTNHPDEALPIYQKLDKTNLGAISAEARYRIAEIKFQQGDLKGAEKQAGYTVQTSSGQDYWIVKCYILLGDILTQEKDYFNAKATLESVVKNSKIPDLKEEAEQKLEKVKALEKENSKL